MRLIDLTDIHGRSENINKISDKITEADAVIISGDITHFGRETDAIKIIENIKKHNSNILAVSGNCDYSGVEHFLTKSGYNLNGTSKSFNGYSIIGLGGSLPCPGKTPNEFTENELEKVLSESISEILNKKNLILVSHQPPVNTLNDEVRDGVHVGSRVVRSFIEKYQPIVCFTGHIHEGIGIDTIGKTKVINPGPLWYGKYAYVQISDGRITELKIQQI